LKVEAAGVSDGGFVFTVHVVTGKSYTVEYSEILNGWQKLREFTATATGSTEVTDPAYSATRERFYRVTLSN
jgi:hypothetical protein